MVVSTDSGMFQSTHSLRSATGRKTKRRGVGKVSIHALLAECDWSTRCWRPSAMSFNPRTPCGVRRYTIDPEKLTSMFQSTHSLRSATFYFFNLSFPGEVSIHALLAECDGPDINLSLTAKGFNPRTPCGVRLSMFTPVVRSKTVSIHALLAECDKGSRINHGETQGFNPRTPCGVRPVS